MGFQISLQEKPGRPIKAFKSKLHLRLKLFTSTNKRSLLQVLIRTNIFKCFTQVARSFICAWTQGRVGQKAGLNTTLWVGTEGSIVNCDFLVTLKDLRPLWFPVVLWCVCALASGLSTDKRSSVESYK
jgi:hypothetical protein